MAQKLIVLLLAAFALETVAGEHVSKKAEPFALNDVSVRVKAPEFQESAQRFADLLGKVLKRKIELKADGNIVFEKAAFSDPQMYEIATSAKGIVFRAASPLGANYAGADLLRELGYRRFTPNPAWEVVPETPPKSIALNKRESPDYKMRSIWPGWNLWFDFRKQDNHKQWHYANRTGGLVIETGHSYDRFIRHNRKIFEAHPEYYALVKGKRNGSKLCISNPEVRKLFAEHSVKILRERPVQASVSADPSDGGGWCECAECAKLGTPTDRAMLLASTAAEAVVKAFPGKHVALYAYNQHSPPPSPGVKVHPAVIVNIATGFIRQGWTIEGLIREWGKRAAIGIREYYYARYEPGSGQACDLEYLRRTIPEFYRSGARYPSGEASDTWGPGFPGYCLAAALLWNTRADADAFLNDLYAKAFPKSEKIMREFYGLILGTPKKALSADLIHRMYDLLGQALKITSGGEKTRIEQLIGWTRFCELLLNHRNKPTKKSFEDMLEIAAAIKPSCVIHTFSIWRNEQRTLGFDGKGLSKKYDWDTPRKLDYEKIVADGLKNNKKLDFEAVSFGYKLVPVTVPGVKNQPGVLDGVRGKQQFYLYSDGSELKLKVTGGLIKHYRDRGAVKIDLIQIGGVSDTGELETKVAHDESVPPDGNPRTVVLKPKYAGLHRLEMNDGNDMTRIEFPAGMPVAYPVPREKMQIFGSICYFYVPNWTKVLGYYAQTNRGCIISPDGKTFAKLTKANGFYSHPVPEKFTGKVWQVRNMKGVFRLLTVPDALNLNSAFILVPETIAKKEGLKQ